MKKTIALLAISGLAAIPGTSMAASASGNCGLGTYVFDGQSGIAPQILAATTNGTSGNQTFGVTTGTMGCDPSATVEHETGKLVFTEENLDQLASDVAAGEGETLATLGDMFGVKEQKQDRFNRVMQENFSRIFPSDKTTAAEVLTSMKSVMRQDEELSSLVS